MKTWNLKYEEVIEHNFEFEAETKDEAYAKYEEAADNGMLDFTHGYPVDSAIVEIEAEGEPSEKCAFSHEDLKRMVDAFSRYVLNDAKAADEDYVRAALEFAGCTREDVRLLNLGFSLYDDEEEEE